LGVRPVMARGIYTSSPGGASGAFYLSPVGRAGRVFRFGSLGTAGQRPGRDLPGPGPRVGV